MFIAALMAVAFAVGAAVATIYSRARREPATSEIDVDIMAFLSEARAFHHQANVAEESNDPAVALQAMERLVAAKRPHPNRKVPEIEEVLADAFARIAELRLKRHELDLAQEAIRVGLTHAPESSYFRGHLVEIDGVIEEARAADFADAGRPEEAQRARTRAAKLLELVVEIQDRVIQHSLAKDGGQ